MNTAKKVLCVMIVLIITLGMYPIASASNFTDSNKINYKEAVDVLAGIAVIEGFPDNSFAPQSNVTRAQATAILTRLLLGRSAADALPDAPTGFPDVDGISGNAFALKYISYCVSHDIVVGHSDGTFRPSDPVTASQFVVMLMRALNIGDPDLYIGSGWEDYAILYGTDNHILDTGVNYKLPANREQTAKYAFNGLLYSPGGETVIVAKDSLASKVYPTLKRNNEGVDALGKQGIVWTYGTPAKVIHSNVVTAVNAQIALVIGFDSKTVSSGGQTTTTYTARIVDTNGVASSVPISAEIFNESGRDAKYRGIVCNYTVAANGEYTFTAPAASAPGEYLIDSGIMRITNRSADLGGGSTVKLADDTTKFVVVNYFTSGSLYGPDGSVTVYTGKNQVPTLSLLTRTTAVSLKIGSSLPDELAETVFIYENVSDAAKELYTFVTGKWAQTTDGFTVDVIEKGLYTSIKVKDETERDKLTALAGSLLKGVTVTSGVVDPGVIWDDNWDASTSISNSDGFLVLDESISGIIVADDTPVYTIIVPESGPTDATISISVANDLRTVLTLADKDFAYIIQSNGIVLAIYIVDKT